jgi:DNA-binding NarL/FixJ family response regulator
MPTKILVAAEPAALPPGWGRGLKAWSALHHVADQAQLKRSLKSMRPDVLLLDLSSPLFGGFHEIPSLRRLSASTKIVLLTDSPDRKEWLSGLKAGAWGYCEKNGGPALLKKVVETMQHGEIWASRALVADMIEELASILDSKKHKKFPYAPKQKAR